MTEQQQSGRLVFDDVAFRSLVDPKGDCDDEQLAAHLGVHRTTYARLRTGEFEPGEVVLRALLARFPDVDPRRVVRYQPTAVGRSAA